MAHYKKLLLFLAIIFLTGCFGSLVSTLPDKAQALPGHLARQPAPVWSVPLHGAEVKRAIHIDKRNILLVTMYVYGTMQQWGLATKDLVLVDTKDGKLKWRIPQSAVKSHVTEVISTGDHVLVAGSDTQDYRPRITALNIGNGDVAWTRTSDEAEASSSWVITDDARSIILASTSDKVISLLAIDPASGKARWEKRFEPSSLKESGPDVSLKQLDGMIMLVGKAVHRINPDNGALMWSYRPGAINPGAINPGAINMEQVFIRRLGQSVMIYDNKNLVALKASSGGPVWKYQSGNAELVAPMMTGGVLFMIERKGKLQTLSRLHPASYKRVWSRDIRDARSIIRVINKRIYYSTRNKLIALSLSNGKPLAQYTLPSFMHTPDGLSDLIVITGGKIIVSRENGVAAFNLRNGKLAYSHEIQGGQGYSYAYLEQKLKLRHLARSGGYQDAGSLVSAIGQANSDMQYRMATGYDEAGATSMGYNASGSSMMVAKSTQLLGATLSFSANFRDAAVMNNLDINKQQMDAAIHSQQASIQHGYYLRPYYNNGWGVTLVRLADGKRADIIHSMPVEPVRINQDMLPLFVIDSKNNRLLVKGIGLQPGPEHTYQKVGFGYDVYESWPGIPNDWIIPNASLLAFDLGTLTFTSRPAKAVTANKASTGPKERALREAIIRNDIAKAGELLEQGANVNAIDAYGMDALMYAAIMDNKDVVALLIENGADATRRDPHGWMAYHYTFMTHAVNRSTGIIRDAHLKQRSQ